MNKYADVLVVGEDSPEVSRIVQKLRDGGMAVERMPTTILVTDHQYGTNTMRDIIAELASHTYVMVEPKEGPPPNKPAYRNFLGKKKNRW